MKSLQWHRFLGPILLILTTAAHADGGGSVYLDKVALSMTSAYAYAAEDYFDKSKTAVVVVMRDRPIDAAAYDAAPDRAKAFGNVVGNMLGTGASLRFVIGSDKNGRAVVEGVDTGYRGQGAYRSGSFTMAPDNYTLDLKVNDGKRIEGTLRSTHESEKTEDHGHWFDLHFALDVASGPPFGPGLPPDGGAPFAGYQAYARALADAEFHVQKETMQALAQTMTDARLGAILAVADKVKDDQWDDTVKAELGKLLAHVPASYEFASGRVNGDVATLTLSGKPRDAGAGDAATTLSVTMKKENGTWRFDKDQKSTGVKSAKPHAAPAGAGKAKH